MYLEDLKDKHKGEIIVVLGAGPSVNSIDSVILQNFTVISVNSGIVKMKGSKKQFYYLSDDTGVKNWSYYINDLPKENAISLLYKDKLENHIGHLDKDKVVLFNHTWWHSPSDGTYNVDGLKLTKSEPIIGARTSAGSAVHWAYIMGATKIVLLGLDCCYKDNKRYFWEDYPKKEQPFMLNGSKFEKRPLRETYKGMQVDRYSMDFLNYWDHFCDANKNILKDEIDMMDCSEGVLNCFSKMDPNFLIFLTRKD
jgi:hypothetical protein